MVETGEHADPKDTAYIVETLLERRSILAKYWLSKVDALSEFSIEPAENGVVLAFRDLMVDCKLACESQASRCGLYAVCLRDQRPTLYIRKEGDSRTPNLFGPYPTRACNRTSAG